METQPLGPPESWTPVEANDDVMSNFDHSINPEVEALLREKDVFSRHAGWNFNGLVWHSEGRFHEQVWVYRQPQKTFSADTLEELMRIVNDEYGWE